MKRKCAMCNGTIQIDRNNTNKAIQYKKKFYHYDCFSELCEQKIATPRTSKQWQDAKLHIDELVEQTTKDQLEYVVRDEMYRWVMTKYNLSCMSDRMYNKFTSIYDGTYKGLAYAISGTELFDEWKYYWDEICGVLGGKNLAYEPAVSYSIAMLLSKNAEYREIKQKEKIEREIIEQQRLNNIEVDIGKTSQSKWKTKNRIADFYQEINGGDGNG